MGKLIVFSYLFSEHLLILLIIWWEVPGHSLKIGWLIPTIQPQFQLHAYMSQWLWGLPDLTHLSLHHTGKIKVILECFMSWPLGYYSIQYNNNLGVSSFKPSRRLLLKITKDKVSSNPPTLKVRYFRNNFWYPQILPKNELTNNGFFCLTVLKTNLFISFLVESDDTKKFLSKLSDL